MVSCLNVFGWRGFRKVEARCFTQNQVCFFNNYQFFGFFHPNSFPKPMAQPVISCQGATKQFLLPIVYCQVLSLNSQDVLVIFKYCIALNIVCTRINAANCNKKVFILLVPTFVFSFFVYGNIKVISQTPGFFSDTATDKLYNRMWLCRSVC